VEKENLVLVHSFPTNSILLAGLVEYLNDFFKVHFIDLPGFKKEIDPLPHISLGNYSRFVEDRIQQFGLSSYVAGGASFGFLVVNNARHNRRTCKGIIGIMPFWGAKSLKMAPAKRVIYTALIEIVCLLRVWKPVWGSRLLREYLPKIRGYPPNTIDVMMDEIDGRTFFETARLLLRDTGDHEFLDLPYVLLANEHDRTVDFELLVNAFTKNVEDLLVISIEGIDHYPQDLSKEYFQEKVPQEVIQQVVKFLARR